MLLLLLLVVLVFVMAHKLKMLIELNKSRILEFSLQDSENHSIIDILPNLLHIFLLLIAFRDPEYDSELLLSKPALVDNGDSRQDLSSRYLAQN